MGRKTIWLLSKQLERDKVLEVSRVGSVASACVSLAQAHILSELQWHSQQRWAYWTKECSTRSDFATHRQPPYSNDFSSQKVTSAEAEKLESSPTVFTPLSCLHHLPLSLRFLWPRHSELLSAHIHPKICDPFPPLWLCSCCLSPRPNCHPSSSVLLRHWLILSWRRGGAFLAFLLRNQIPTPSESKILQHALDLWPQISYFSFLRLVFRVFLYY